MTISEQVIDFYKDFQPPIGLPNHIHLHNPWDDKDRRAAITEFCNKFYNDSTPRIHLIGINPSKLVKTSTGVNYTDGYALQNRCGIGNDFDKHRELTSEFFYRMSDACGDANKLYSNIFAWALMPFAITSDGLYKNHYDAEVASSVDTIIRANLDWLSRIPSTGRAVVLGKGKNAAKFDALVGTSGMYREIIILPHPRWILQYQRKDVDKFIDQYLNALT